MWQHRTRQHCSPDWHTMTPVCPGSCAAGQNQKKPTQKSHQDKPPQTHSWVQSPLIELALIHKIMPRKPRGWGSKWDIILGREVPVCLCLCLLHFHQRWPQTCSIASQGSVAPPAVSVSTSAAVSPLQRSEHPPFSDLWPLVLVGSWEQMYPPVLRVCLCQAESSSPLPSCSWGTWRNGEGS